MEDEKPTIFGRLKRLVGGSTPTLTPDPEDFFEKFNRELEDANKTLDAAEKEISLLSPPIISFERRVVENLVTRSEVEVVTLEAELNVWMNSAQASSKNSSARRANAINKLTASRKRLDKLKSSLESIGSGVTVSPPSVSISSSAIKAGSISSSSLVTGSISAASISASSISPSSSGGYEPHDPGVDYDDIPHDKLLELAASRLSMNDILGLIDKHVDDADRVNEIFVSSLLTKAVTACKRRPSGILPAYVADLVELTLSHADAEQSRSMIERINCKVEDMNTVVEGEEEDLIEEDGKAEGGSPIAPDFGSW